MAALCMCGYGVPDPPYLPLSLWCSVYVTANVSGGHLNPAVTIATLITGHTSLSRGLYYIIAQCLGSVLASTLHVSQH
jgi:glycerol uptake facilitator-like aquaporin